MKARLTLQTYVACPNCGGGQHRVDHLFDRLPHTFGPWNCRECTRSFRGTVNSETDIELELTDEHIVRTLNLLVLMPQDKPVFFVVEGMRWPNRKDGDQEEDDRARYFYEEHSCPTNFISCDRIVSEGDTDPHGLFDYIRKVDKPMNYRDIEGDDFWNETFPEMFAPASVSIEDKS